MGGWNLVRRREGLHRKRVLVIAAEGEVTEPQYFQRLNSMSSGSIFYVIENWGNGSDPRHVLERMKHYLKKNPVSAEDEAWIVIDQDKWPEDALRTIRNWAEATGQFYAISIRKFEDWLRLHVQGEPDAERKYRNFLIGKDKHLPEDFVTKARVMHAISLAHKYENTKRSVGNIYQLLEKFLA